MIFEDLKPNQVLRGPLFPEPVQVIVAVPLGAAVKLTGKGLTSGQVIERILTLEQLALLQTTPDAEPFNGELHTVRLGNGRSFVKIEHYRLRQDSPKHPLGPPASSRPPPPQKCALPTRPNTHDQPCANSPNPNGIAPPSPGLRSPRYPGNRQIIAANPIGVVPILGGLASHRSLASNTPHHPAHPPSKTKKHPAHGGVLSHKRKRVFDAGDCVHDHLRSTAALTLLKVLKNLYQ